jgi:hypothetical protein
MYVRSAFVFLPFVLFLRIFLSLFLDPLFVYSLGLGCISHLFICATVLHRFITLCFIARIHLATPNIIFAFPHPNSLLIILTPIIFFSLAFRAYTYEGI